MSVRSIYKSSILKGALALVLIGGGMAQEASAQLSPFGASWFQNQYLNNPAMSGLKEGTLLNGGYRQLASTISGSGSSQYLTGEHRFSNRVGVGLMAVNDEAGLIRNTTLRATYTYHLPLEGEKGLHFGISAGGAFQSLDQKAMSGEIDDPLVIGFQDRGFDFDADFGAAYTDGKLTVQGAFPNMVTYFRKGESDLVNRTTFFAAASYKLKVGVEEDEVGVEPKLGYRGIQGQEGIIDGGVNLSFKEELLNLYGMYHSSKNLTFGLGIRIKEVALLSAAYTTQPSGLSQEVKGNMEFGVRFQIK